MKYNKTITVIAAALILNGCQPRPTIDAASDDAFNNSTKQLTSQLMEVDSKRFAESIAKFNRMRANPPLAFPDWRVVDGMTASEFERLVESLQDNIVHTQKTALFPNERNTQQLLKSIQSEVAQLKSIRDNLVDEGMSVQDQYQVLDVLYFPPSNDLPLKLDKARVAFKLQNDSPYDVYRPEFLITISNPNDGIEVIQRKIQFDQEKEPIKSKSAKSFTFECCDVLNDVSRNETLKTLGHGIDLEITLEQIRNYQHRETMEKKRYTKADAERLRRLETCIAELQNDPATWAPKPIDDPCLTHPEKTQTQEPVAAL